MRPNLLLTALLLSSTVSFVSADVLYHVTPATDGSRIAVEVQVPVKENKLTIQMPSWMPGAYAVGTYGKAVQDIAARSDSGTTMEVAHPAPDTWETMVPIGTKRVTFSYAIPSGARSGGFMSAGFDGKLLHWSGPSTYVYVVGRKTEKCRLNVSVPSGWNIGIGLKPERDGATFTAKNYDVLADNPVTVGEFTPLTFEMRGKEHQLNFRGPARDNIDRDKTRALCEFVTKSASDFFGGVPYDKYVFHFFVSPGQNGAGGLEHASSAQMFARAGLGPGTIFGTCHEYFHLWNVKRIRSAPLGPFDYTQLPIGRAHV